MLGIRRAIIAPSRVTVACQLLERLDLSHPECGCGGACADPARTAAAAMEHFTVLSMCDCIDNQSVAPASRQHKPKLLHFVAFCACIRAQVIQEWGCSNV